MRIYLQDSRGAVSEPATLNGVKLQECRLLWVDIDVAVDQEMGAVVDFFGIHPVAREECVKPSSVPKVQEFPDHIFIMWDFLRDSPDTEKLESSTFSMFLGDNYLLTVRSQEIPELERVREKLIQDPSIFRGNPAPLLYSILDTAVDEYFPLVEELTDRIDDYMDRLLTGEEEGDLKAILVFKHRNMAIRRVVVAHRDVVMKLARRDVPFIPEDLTIYLLDIFDHLVRIITEVDNNTDPISASLDIHVNTVSNRLNMTMKRLTAIALIFMPLTFLVGLYGMNFKYMPELSCRYGYLFAWVSLVVIALIMIYIARKKIWL